jgi:tetratricopeptide (TPR) repeat protein
MATRRNGQVFLLFAACALSACASAELSLRDAIRKNQEEATRFEQAGQLRASLERWKIVSAIDPHAAGAGQKQSELEAKIREEAQRRIAAGKNHLQRRDKGGAQRELVAALRLDPRNREALDLLYQSEQQFGEQTAFARPLRGGGGVARAAPADEGEEEEESGEEVTLAEAAEIFRRGDYLAAIDAFNRVLAQEPGQREAMEYQKLAYYNQGLAYMGKESYGEALKMFERLRRIQPDYKRLPHYLQTAREKLADQHHLAAIRYFQKQQLKEAIEEWDQALALNPKLESARRSQERARRLLKSLQEHQ